VAPKRKWKVNGVNREETRGGWEGGEGARVWKGRGEEVNRLHRHFVGEEKMVGSERGSEGSVSSLSIEEVLLLQYNDGHHEAEARWIECF
jgi:hypothetical protein